MFLAGEKCAKDSVSLWLGEISSGLLRVSTWDLWALLGSLLWRRQCQPTPVLLPGKFRDGGAWWAAVHGVAKSWTWLSNFSFPFHFPALEKEMATHSSVLARRIPGMGKPGGLPSVGSRKVGHDWSDLAAAAAGSLLGSLDYFYVIFIQIPLTYFSLILG